MKTELDHLVVAALTLKQGISWVEGKLGVMLAAGGKHAFMGTHNGLLKIGPREFLEVIAIDPGAPAPPRPRWFELDSPAMKQRLAKGPALVHWVERTDDIEGQLRAYSEPIEILSLSRGVHRWRMGIPSDGSFPGGGGMPTLIQWEEGPHPAEVLPESGCSLKDFRHGRGWLEAAFSTPSGVRTIP